MKRMIAWIGIGMLGINLMGCSSMQKISGDTQLKEGGREEEIKGEVKGEEAKDGEMEITIDQIEDSIYGNEILTGEMEFVKDVNTLVEKTEESQYIIHNIYNYIGSKKKEAEFIEGDNIEYNVNIEYINNQQFPSILNFTYICNNEIDADNLLAWSYQTAGNFLPVKLASNLQNASFNGLTKNSYKTDNLSVSIYKTIENIEGDCNYITIGILVNLKNEHEEKSNKDKLIIKENVLGMWEGNSIKEIEKEVGDILQLNNIELVYYSSYNTDTSYIEFSGENKEKLSISIEKGRLYGETEGVSIESIRRLLEKMGKENGTKLDIQQIDESKITFSYNG